MFCRLGMAGLAFNAMCAYPDTTQDTKSGQQGLHARTASPLMRCSDGEALAVVQSAKQAGQGRPDRRIKEVRTAVPTTCCSDGNCVRSRAAASASWSKPAWAPDANRIATCSATRGAWLLLSAARLLRLRDAHVYPPCKPLTYT